MAVYGNDHPGYFDLALRSVLRQAEDGIAVHVYLGVDGPLPPALQATVDEHRASLHRVSASADRCGLARTLNRLIELLEDEPFVFRMDSDDLSEPHRFRRQLDYLHVHPEVDILGGAMVEFLENGSELPPRRYPRSQDVRRAISRGSPLSHPTVCFRRQALDRLGAYPTEGTNEDIAMWFKALAMGMTLDNIDDVLLKFRLTSNTFGRRSLKKARSELRVYLRGLRTLEGGASIAMAFPIARFLFRLAPRRVVGLVYRLSGLRSRLIGR